jgi:hypothetical protein
LGIQVRLEDQFGLTTVIVLEGRLFCNPVKKTTPDGTAYPILDPWAHMTCYRVQNPDPLFLPVFYRDQFFEAEILLRENFFLCLPALKRAVLEATTWDHIKALDE